MAFMFVGVLSLTSFFIVGNFGGDLLGTELTTWYIDGESLSYYSSYSSVICGGFDDTTGYIWLWEPNESSGNTYKYDIASKTLEYVDYLSSQASVFCVSSPSSFFYNGLMYLYDDDDGIYTFNFNSDNGDVGSASSISPPEYFDDPCFMLSKDETQFYLVGDESGESTKFYIYDISEEAWTQGPSMNYPHGEGACAISQNNDLYIMGGVDDGIIEKINLDSLSSWQVLNIQLSGGGSNGRSSVVMENIIYVFGGMDDSTVYYIDTNDDSIDTLDSSLVELDLYYMLAIVVPPEHGGDNRIYVFGGSDSDSGDYSQAIRYSNELKNTDNPTAMPSFEPTAKPTSAPTAPTQSPVPVPSQMPTEPSIAPSNVPTSPTYEPTQPTIAPSDAPTVPTIIPSEEPTYDGTKYVCSDGCVISIDYVDDNYCDCAECDDETNWDCDTCNGVCPTTCGYFDYCPDNSDDDYSDDRDCIDDIIDGFQVGDVINVIDCAEQICDSDIGGVIQLLSNKAEIGCEVVSGLDSIIDIIDDIFGDDDTSYLGIVATCWESEIYTGMKANYTAFEEFIYNYSYLLSSINDVETDSDNYIKYDIGLSFDEDNDNFESAYTLSDDNMFVAAIYDSDGTTKSEMVTYAITSLIEQYRDIFAYSDIVYNFTSEGEGDNLFKILRSNQGVLFTDHFQDLVSDYQTIVCEANVVVYDNSAYSHGFDFNFMLILLSTSLVFIF